MLGAPLIVAVLAGISVMIFFMAVWLILQRRDPVEERLQAYGLQQESSTAAIPVGAIGSRYANTGFGRILSGFGLGPRLALTLARADSPLKVTEFVLITLGLGLLGFIIGTLRYNALLGLLVGLVLGVIPTMVVRTKQRRRLRAFTQQLPDLLTLLVGGLRAGYGLNQSMEMLVERMGPPASDELAKVVRAVNLGLPLRQALEDAVIRVGSDDFNLVVVAINIHYDTGGNLAETLDTIADTVRDRLRLLAEIRVMTAQQRFTGYVLGALPILVGVLIFFMNPEYMSGLFEPGITRALPIAGVLLQVMGFIVIRRIVDIEV